MADRLVDQHCGDSRIDTARKTADHLALADLAADLLDRFVLERAHGPVAGTAGDIAHEVVQDRRAVRRVHDFEMELGGVEFALLVRDHGDRRVRRGTDRDEALRRPGHAIAVAHPYRITLTDLPHAVIECRSLGDLDLGAAEFTMMPGFDRAAQLLRHGLLAVANAEYRHSGLKDRLRRKRCILVEHGGRSARKDHALRLEIAQRGFGVLERHDLAVDVVFAHAPRDELGHLRAKIDNEDGVVGRHGGFSGGRFGLSSQSSVHPARRRMLTKNPSVSVRRGVISNPCSEISAARLKR